MQDKKKKLGLIALFTMTVIWGASFVIMKSTLDSISTLYILAFRFSGAAVIMRLISIKSGIKLDKNYWIGGILMGVMLFLAYVFQTYGLERTTPGKNAFLTAVYCVLVPFFYWAIIKRKPDRYNIMAAGLCIIGIGLISLGDDMSVNSGDMLTLIGGVFFAVHIIVVAGYTRNRNIILLAMVQFFTAGALAWIAAAIFEPFPEAVPSSAIWSIVYLCVFSTALCFFLQMFGQKYTPPAQAAVIMTLESVFGAAVSVFFFGEELTLKLVLGFIFTFAAVLISETKLSFLRPKKSSLEPSVEKPAEP